MKNSLLLGGFGLALFLLGQWNVTPGKAVMPIVASALSVEEHLLRKWPVPVQRLKTHQDWEVFPNIGPSLSEKLLQANRRGDLKNLESVDQVPGIGPNILANLKPHLAFF